MIRKRRVIIYNCTLCHFTWESNNIEIDPTCKACGRDSNGIKRGYDNTFPEEPKGGEI